MACNEERHQVDRVRVRINLPQNTIIIIISSFEKNIKEMDLRKAYKKLTPKST
jgi:hypothetical protein